MKLTCELAVRNRSGESQRWFESVSRPQCISLVQYVDGRVR